MLGTILLAVLVVLADQMTKYLALLLEKAAGGDKPLIPGVLHFTLHRNRGMGWGLLQDARWVFLSLTIVLMLAIVAFFIVTRKKKKHETLTNALALIFAGGFGNMIDRTFYGDRLFDGSVIDFISFRLIDFPIFNLADAAVTAGAVLFIVYILFFDEKMDGEGFSFTRSSSGNSPGKTT